MDSRPTPLFDSLDRLQIEGHGTHPVKRLNDDPPVTPDPTPAERRDEGIRQATEHADAEQPIPKWSEQADKYVTMMIDRRGFKPFLFEEMVEAAKRDGVPEPPDGRAWGGVARRLAKKGLIRNMGYAKAKTSNLSPKVLWCKAVETSGR